MSAGRGYYRRFFAGKCRLKACSMQAESLLYCSRSEVEQAFSLHVTQAPGSEASRPHKLQNGDVVFGLDENPS